LPFLPTENILTAVDLLYKILPKQFQGFWLTLFFSFGKSANFLKIFANNLEFCHFSLCEIECLL